MNLFHRLAVELEKSFDVDLTLYNKEATSTKERVLQVARVLVRAGDVLDSLIQFKEIPPHEK